MVQIINIAREILSFLSNIPIGRTIYTFIILLVLLILARDLVSLWTQQTLYLGRFEYYGEGKSNSDYANQLRAETVHYYTAFVETINSEIQERRAALAAPASETNELDRWVKGTDKFATNRGQDLSGLELSIQGVNIPKMVSYVFSLLNRSPEVTATIIKDSKLIRILLTYPKGDKTTGPRGDSRVDLSNVGDDSEAATKIACFLIWAQSDEEHARFWGVPFDEFCDWMRAIYLKHISIGTSREYFSEKAFNKNTEFARTYMKQAFSGRARYAQAYLAAADLADRDAAGSMAIGNGRPIRYSHLAPYLRYIYLRMIKNDTSILPAVTSFYEELQGVTEPRIESEIDLANAFFRKTAGLLCGTPEGARLRERRVLDRVARVTISLPQGRIEELTGAIITEQFVVAPDWWDDDTAAGLKGNVKLETVNCDGGVSAHTIEKVEVLTLGSERASRFSSMKLLLLTAPGVGRDLKQAQGKGKASGFDYSHQGQAVYEVGFSYNFAKLFRPLALGGPPIEHVGVSNIYFVKGRILVAGEQSVSPDESQYLTNDAAIAPGMHGSPIFSPDGELIGIQSLISYTTGWWPVSKAIPVSKIHEVLASRANAGANR